MKKSNIVGIVIIIISVVFCAVLLSNVSKDYKEIIMTIPSFNNYSIEDESFNVDIFSNDKNSVNLDSEYISMIKFANIDNSNDITFKLNDIVVNDGFTYDGVYFYKYTYVFENSITDYTFKYEEDDCFIEIKNIEGDTYRYSIGSVSIRDTRNISTDLQVTKLSGLSDNYEGVETLSGIVMTLSNKTSESITITNFDLRNDSVVVSNKNVDTVIYTISSLESINDIVNNFDYKVANSSFKENIVVLPNNDIELILPICYLDKVFYVNKVDLMIEYEINRNTSTYYTGDFVYFENSINRDDVVIYEVNN